MTRFSRLTALTLVVAIAALASHAPPAEASTPPAAAAPPVRLAPIADTAITLDTLVLHASPFHQVALFGRDSVNVAERSARIASRICTARSLMTIDSAPRVIR